MISPSCAQNKLKRRRLVNHINSAIAALPKKFVLRLSYINQRLRYLTIENPNESRNKNTNLTCHQLHQTETKMMMMMMIMPTFKINIESNIKK